MKNNDFFKKMTQEDYEMISNARKLINNEKKSLALFELELNCFKEFPEFDGVLKELNSLKKTINDLDIKLKDFEI